MLRGGGSGSVVKVCVQCQGSGVRKFVSNNRQFEEECTACGGEGYVGQQKAGVQPAEVEDPIKTQARLLGIVRQKLNDDPAEFAIFMQFTMEFGKRAISADQYVFFLIDKLGAVSRSCVLQGAGRD